MTIRPLEPGDIAAFHALRLRALREHPEAFGQHADEMGTVEEFAARQRSNPHGFVLGAFEDDALVGTVGVNREAACKVRHRAFIWGMYVRPESAGRGVGRALVERALAEVRATMPGVELVTLKVVTRNERAGALYRSMGFEVYGVEPRAIRLDDGTFLDDALMWRTL